ncbi:MAG: aminotransferase class IV [Cyclobacteriaceae bacterium]|nr:aminotransferase class IV [Cyclobacteriaceae bacterium]
MCRLVESIYLNNGVFRNLRYHQARMEQAATNLFSKPHLWDLEEVLKSVVVPATGLYKVRFVYDLRAYKVEFVPYQFRAITTLKKIEADDLRYEYKYEDRAALASLWEQRGPCDEILIIKNGKVTDTSYANLAFKYGHQWLTPVAPLLNGTMRQYLIDTKKIYAADIEAGDLEKFECVKLINAMWGWDAPELPIANIS